MWGVYGIFLHKGQVKMADPEFGRYKAFFIVGIAYFVVAILGPALLMWVKGSGWSMSKSGVSWSFLAGTVGAIGAFCVLLAFGAVPDKTRTFVYVPIVMSIIFAGAPILNALVSMWEHRGEIESVKPMFYVGILLAALGGALVTFNKPKVKKHSPSPAAVEASADLGDSPADGSGGSAD